MKITREHQQTDRYAFDFGECSTANGFAQIDTAQDASYYGQWCNPETLVIVSYIEGDVTRKQCETGEEFAETLQHLKAWTNAAGYDFRGIDPGCRQPAIRARFVALGLSDMLHPEYRTAGPAITASNQP
jgi:hypothetical protein